MEITLGGGDTARVQSLNVSANGVYFSSDRYIAPLTKLRITLDLADGGEAATPVVCDGVVVRIMPEQEVDNATEYEVAAYFTEVAEEGRDFLEKYILKQMAF